MREKAGDDVMIGIAVILWLVSVIAIMYMLVFLTPPQLSAECEYQKAQMEGGLK